MAQWVKRQTLDFGSGHDLTVCEIDRAPASGSPLTARSPFGILSPSLSAHVSALNK